MCDQTEITYDDGEVVWVKLGTCWWPGQVVGYEKLPEDIQQEFKKKPLIAAVQFFQEDKYEYVKNLQQIYKYNCTQKDEFIKKGLDKYRTKSKDGSSYMDKFPDDVITAEKLTGGDIKILNSRKFSPAEKPDISSLFGEKKLPKKKLRDKDDNNYRRSLSTNDGNYKMTPPRYFKSSGEHEIRIRHQTNSQPTTPNNSPSTTIYSCPLCSFTSTRVNVIICHNKSHRSCGWERSNSPGPIVPKNRASLNSIESPKRKYVRKNKSFSHRSPNDKSGGESLKRKSTKSMEKMASKKKKSDPELREKLLADWDDGSDDDDMNQDAPVELNKSTDSGSSLVQANQPDQADLIDEKNDAKNDDETDSAAAADQLLRESEKLIDETLKISSQIDESIAKEKQQTNSVKVIDDNENKNDQAATLPPPPPPPPIVTGKSKILGLKKFKKINLDQDKRDLDNDTNKEQDKSKFSCFDFEDDEPEPAVLPPVRKLARVFGEKNMSLKKEIIKEFTMSQAALANEKDEEEKMKKFNKRQQFQQQKQQKQLEEQQEQEQQQLKKEKEQQEQQKKMEELQQQQQEEELQKMHVDDEDEKLAQEINKTVSEASDLVAKIASEAQEANLIKSKAEQTVTELEIVEIFQVESKKNEEIEKTEQKVEEKMVEDDFFHDGDAGKSLGNHQEMKIDEKFTEIIDKDEKFTEKRDEDEEFIEKPDEDEKFTEKLNKDGKFTETRVKEDEKFEEKHDDEEKFTESRGEEEKFTEKQDKEIKFSETIDKTDEKLMKKRDNKDKDDEKFRKTRDNKDKTDEKKVIVAVIPEIDSGRVTIEEEEDNLPISQMSAGNKGKEHGLRSMGWTQLSEIIGGTSGIANEKPIEEPVKKRRGRPRKVSLPPQVQDHLISGNGDPTMKIEELPGTPDSQDNDRKTSESDNERSYTGRKRKPNKKYLESEIYSSSPGRRTPKTDDSQSETETEKTPRETKRGGGRGAKKTTGYNKKISENLRASVDEFEFIDQNFDHSKELISLPAQILKSPGKKSDYKPSPVHVTDLLASSDVEIRSSVQSDVDMPIVDTDKRDKSPVVDKKVEDEVKRKVEMLPPKKSQIKKFEASQIDLQDAANLLTSVVDAVEKVQVQVESTKMDVELMNQLVDDGAKEQKQETAETVDAVDASADVDVGGDVTVIQIDETAIAVDASVDVVQDNIETILAEQMGEGLPIKDDENRVDDDKIDDDSDDKMSSIETVMKQLVSDDEQPMKDPVDRVCHLPERVTEATPEELLKRLEEAEEETPKINEKIVETEPVKWKDDKSGESTSVITETIVIEVKDKPFVDDTLTTTSESNLDTLETSQEAKSFDDNSRLSAVSTPSPSSDVSVPVKKREKPRIIENVQLKEPMHILKSKLLEKQPIKAAKHKLDDSPKRSFSPKQKIMKLESHNSAPIPIAPKIPVVKAEEQLGNEKIVTAIGVEEGEKVVQQSQQSLEDMELDINSIPFVLSEDLNPETIGQMPVVISSIIPVSSTITTPLTISASSPTIVTQPLVSPEVAVAAPAVVAPVAPLEEPETITIEASPKKKTASPAILKNKSKAKPTITSIRTLNPPLSGGVKGLKFQNQAGKTTQLITQKGTSGKYVIVQTSGSQQLRYTVQGKAQAAQKIAIPTDKAAGNAQIVQQGSKVVILTSPQSGQAKMVPINFSKGKIQKIVSKNVPTSTFTVKSPIGKSQDASSSQTTSKMTPGSKIITPKGVLSQVSGAKVVGNLSAGIIKNYTPAGKAIINQKTLVTSKGTVLSPIPSQGGQKTIFTTLSPALTSKTLITTTGLVPSKGTVLTPITGQQVKAIAAKSPAKLAAKLQYQSVQQKVQLPMVQKIQKQTLGGSGSPVKVVKPTMQTIVLQSGAGQQLPTVGKTPTGKKIIRQHALVTSGARASAAYQQGSPVSQTVQRKSLGGPPPLQKVQGSRSRVTKAQNLVVQDPGSSPSLASSSSAAVAALAGPIKASPLTVNVSKGLVHQPKHLLSPGKSSSKMMKGSPGLVKNMQQKILMLPDDSKDVGSLPGLPAVKVDTGMVAMDKSATDYPANDQVAVPEHPATVSEISPIVDEHKVEVESSKPPPQIMALPTESSDGTQTYVLVTVDDNGQIQPLDNNALLSLEGTTQNPDGTRTLYIDPSSLGETAGLDNIVLQFDNNSLPNIQPGAVETSQHQPISSESYSAPSEIIQSSNQDILAAALANTDFQQEIGLPDNPTTSVMSTGLTQTSLINQTILQSTIIPTSEPISASAVLETSLTLNQPIMTPLEVPSSLSLVAEVPPVITSTPTSLELPITITNTNISYIAAEPSIQIPGNSMPDISGDIMATPTQVDSELKPVGTQYLVIPNIDDGASQDGGSSTPSTSYAVSIPETVSGQQTPPSMPIIDDSYPDTVSSEPNYDQVSVTDMLIPKSKDREMLISQSVDEEMSSRAVDEEILSSKPVDEEMLSSKPVDEEMLTSKPVDEQMLSLKPVDEEMLSSKPVDEEMMSSKPVDEEMLSSKPVDEEMMSSKPVDEQMLSLKPVDEEMLISKSVDGGMSISKPVEEEMMISEQVDEEMVISKGVEEKMLISKPVEEETFVTKTVDEDMLMSNTVDEQMLISRPVEEKILSPKQVEEEMLTSNIVEEEMSTPNIVDEEMLTLKAVEEEMSTSKMAVQEMLTLNTVDEEMLVSKTTEEEMSTQKTVEEEMLTQTPAVEEMLTSKTIEEEMLIQTPAVEEMLTSKTVEEEMLTPTPVAEEILTTKTVEEEMLTTKTAEEEIFTSKTVEEEMLMSKTVEEEMLTPKTTEEEIFTSKMVEEEMLTSKSVDEEMLTTKTIEEETFISKTVEEETSPSETIEEEMLTSRTTEEEMLTPTPDVQEMLTPKTIEENRLSTLTPTEEETSTRTPETRMLTSNELEKRMFTPSPVQEKEDILTPKIVEDEFLGSTHVEDSTLTSMAEEETFNQQKNEGSSSTLVKITEENSLKDQPCVEESVDESEFGSSIRDMPIVVEDEEKQQTQKEDKEGDDVLHQPDVDVQNAQSISSCAEIANEDNCISSEVQSSVFDAASSVDVEDKQEETKEVEDELLTSCSGSVQAEPISMEIDQHPTDSVAPNAGVSNVEAESLSQNEMLSLETSQEAPSQSYDQVDEDLPEISSQSAFKEESSREPSQSIEFQVEAMDQSESNEPPTQSFDDSSTNEATQSGENPNTPTQSSCERVNPDDSVDDPNFPTQSYEVDKAENLSDAMETDGELSQEGNIPSQSNDVDGIGTSSFILSNNTGLNEDETASSSYVPETPEPHERDQDQESAISTSSYEIPTCDEINIASSSIPDTSIRGEHMSIHDNGVPEIPTSSYSLNPDSSSTHVDAVPTSSYDDQVVIEQSVSTSYHVPISMPGLEGNSGQNFVSESSDQRDEPTSYYARHPEDLSSEASQSYFIPEGPSPSYTTQTASPSYYDHPPPESEASQSYYSRDMDRTTTTTTTTTTSTMEQSRNVEASQSFYQESSDDLRLRRQHQGEATPTYTERYPIDYTLDNSPIDRHDLVESSVPATRSTER